MKGISIASLNRTKETQAQILGLKMTAMILLSSSHLKKKKSKPHLFLSFCFKNDDLSYAAFLKDDKDDNF